MTLQRMFAGFAVCVVLLAGCGAVPAAQLPTILPPTAIPPTALPATPVPPTETSTPIPATATSVPPTETSTPIPATATSVPPTDAPTDTPLPPTPILPTATPLPPTPLPTEAASADAPTVAPATEGFAYVFPVSSEGKISYGKYHHDYPAADIFCPIGSKFLAPTSGVVEWVTTEDHWDPTTNKGDERGGLSVAMVGDDGVRYYGSHLSAVADGIASGTRVEAGALLGLTGKSGDARNTDPHLHFGISHPTTPDDWQTRRGEVAPYPYLKAWQRGENLTPQL